MKNKGKYSLLLEKLSYNKYFRKIFETLNIKYEEIQAGEDLLFKVKNTNGLFWFSTKLNKRDSTPVYYPNGSFANRSLLSNKYHTYKALQNIGYQGIETLCFSKHEKISKIPFPFPVFIKPLDATLGQDCYKALDQNAVLKSINQVFSNGHSTAIIQPYIDKPEFRVVTVGTKIIYAYHKGKPQIEGDGKSSIETLIKKFNDNRFGAKIPEELYANIALHNILKTGETIILGDTTCFKQGGTVIELFDPSDISPQTHTFFENLVTKMGLENEVLGFDIFGKDIGTMEEVIEINTNPGNFGLPSDWTYDIYRKIFGV